MSTETDPAKMPKDALEAEPDAGEANQAVNLILSRSISQIVLWKADRFGIIFFGLALSRGKTLEWPLCPPSHKSATSSLPPPISSPPLSKLSDSKQAITR